VFAQATFDPTRYNKSGNRDFQTVLEKRLQRRTFLKSGSALAGMVTMTSLGLSGCSGDDDDPVVTPTPTPTPEPTPVSLGFESIAGSKTDAVAIPPGYKANVLAPWGTPLNDNAMPWKDDGTNTSEDQANAVGMHHDGMWYFPIDDSSEDGILCINHEYLDQNALHPNGATVVSAEDSTRTIPEEIRKEINAHGVSVVRIQKNNGSWDVVTNDPLNRRFTGATEMKVSGPLGGSDLLITKFSADGSAARGTLNNCGNGFTPWGTYLTCEENWPGYFTNSGALSADQTRIGLSDEGTRYGWEDVAGDASEANDEFTRFDVTPTGNSAAEDYRNEANGHGYIVEMDPYDASTMAVKRTALGRFRHEGCVPGRAIAGEPIVFYSGHDARFEYIYKFVSDTVWDPADADATDRLAVGDKYMDSGTLYVARFNEDGTGEWLPLTMDSPVYGLDAEKNLILTGETLSDKFASLEEIILNTAGAADELMPTPMDRPEWGAVDPDTGMVYMTLTNNTDRTGEDEDTKANAANPRLNNAFGHVIRWEEGDDATSFSWDIFVFGSPSDGDAATNLSGLTDLNQFASPDGLVFDTRGILWVQTDNGADEVEEETNDQMLAVIPSQLAAGTSDSSIVDTTNQAALKRFFVGPNGCEVTGLAKS